jgi:hypothetical protein
MRYLFKSSVSYRRASGYRIFINHSYLFESSASRKVRTVSTQEDLSILRTETLKKGSQVPSLRRMLIKFWLLAS